LTAPAAGDTATSLQPHQSAQLPTRDLQHPTSPTLLATSPPICNREHPFPYQHASCHTTILSHCLQLPAVAQFTSITPHSSLSQANNPSSYSPSSSVPTQHTATMTAQSPEMHSPTSGSERPKGMLMSRTRLAQALTIGRHPQELRLVPWQFANLSDSRSPTRSKSSERATAN
jgi:hypothetical protein